jgi:hypothetical protein
MEMSFRQGVPRLVAPQQSLPPLLQPNPFCNKNARPWECWNGPAPFIGSVHGRRDTLRELLHRHKKKEKKAKVAPNKATIASVTREMAQPRMRQSVHIKTDMQTKQGAGELL